METSIDNLAALARQIADLSAAITKLIEQRDALQFENAKLRRQLGNVLYADAQEVRS